MKRIKTLALALACIIVLMLSLTSCGPIKNLFFDEEGNFIGLDKFFRDGEEDEYVENIELWNGSAYELEYESNGDGTCTVFIRTNAYGTFSSFGSGVLVYDEAYERVSSEKIYYSAGKIDGAILIPSEDITANYYTVPTSYSVEIPEISPDGDRVTAVGDSEFLAYANVPRILDVEAFERILDKLENNNKISDFELNKFKVYYFLQDPSQVTTSVLIDQMKKAYPVTRVMPVYVLDEEITVKQLETISEILEKYANYTASDYKNDFNSFKSKVAEEDSAIAETLEYGNFADNIERVVLPSSVVKIASHAFEGCYNMEHIEIHGDIEELGDYAFSGCKKLQTVHLHDGGLARIGEGVFMNCENLRDVHLPESVTEIGRSAFEGCTSLYTVDVPTTLQTIGDYAFMDCSALEGIVIPYTTTYIGTNAFVGCDSLSVAEFACTDGWVRTDNYGNAENITFSDAETNISYLKAEGFEYTRISR